LALADFGLSGAAGEKHEQNVAVQPVAQHSETGAQIDCESQGGKKIVHA
jgi:hypothetical protein